MPRLSIRRRLTAWFSGVLLFGLALFGAGMWFALERRLVEGLDVRLAQRAEGLRMVVELEAPLRDRPQLREELAEFAREVPDGALMQLRDGAGDLLPPPESRPAFPEYLGGAGPAFRTIVKNGGAYRLHTASFVSGGGRYEAAVAVPLDEVRAVMRVFRNLLLLLIPAVLAAAGLGGYWISRRALAPVDEITRQARSISIQNLSRRLTLPDTGDELQRMSETWNDVLARLDGAVQRIRQFTADASHELRTPVSLIRGTAELALRRERPPEEYRRALRDIQEEAQRMTDLTESLLALARADSGQCGMPLEAVDVGAVVDGVVSHAAAAAAERGVRLEARMADGRAVASANESGLRRLLLILVENALKHTGPGGCVTVSAASAEGGVVAAVEDNGEGIPPAALPHIFERFFRADAARSGGSGAGLGLSIAQAIAHAHGSEITVESAPGAGARFSLYLKS